MLGHTPSMSRRLATLLLAILLAVTSTGLCARGAQACTMVKAAGHDCCSGKSLWATDCCCPAKAQTAKFPASHGEQSLSSMPLLAVAPAILPPAAALLASRPLGVVLARALAPPDTPVSRHTSLLL